MYLVQDAVPDRAGIYQDDGILGLIEGLEYDIDQVVLLLWIVWRVRQVNRRLEPGTLDLFPDHV